MTKYMYINSLILVEMSTRKKGIDIKRKENPKKPAN